MLTVKAIVWEGIQGGLHAKAGPTEESGIIFKFYAQGLAERKKKQLYYNKK